jgi:hypothetical protein
MGNASRALLLALGLAVAFSCRSDAKSTSEQQNLARPQRTMPAPDATLPSVLRGFHDKRVPWTAREMLDESKQSLIAVCDSLRKTSIMNSKRTCTTDADCIGSIACVSFNRDALPEKERLERQWQARGCGRLLDCSSSTSHCEEGSCEQYRQ